MGWAWGKACKWDTGWTWGKGWPSDTPVGQAIEWRQGMPWRQATPWPSAIKQLLQAWESEGTAPRTLSIPQAP